MSTQKDSGSGQPFIQTDPETMERARQRFARAEQRLIQHKKEGRAAEAREWETVAEAAKQAGHLPPDADPQQYIGHMQNDSWGQPHTPPEPRRSNSPASSSLSEAGVPIADVAARLKHTVDMDGYAARWEKNDTDTSVPLDTEMIKESEALVDELLDKASRNTGPLRVEFTARQRRVWVLTVTTGNHHKMSALISDLGEYCLSKGLKPRVDWERHQLTLTGERHRLNGVTSLLVTQYLSAQISLAPKDFDTLLEESSLGSPHVKATLAEPNPNPPHLEG